MALPPDVRSYHTVWVTAPGRRPVPVRYALDGDDLVCFGDDGLSAVPAGTHVSATVHKIACGPPVATFGAVVRDLAPDDVPLGLVAEVAGNLSLVAGPDGRDPVDALRHNRRLVALHG
jgi:hypothetical protein